MSIVGKKFLLEHCFQEINSMEEQEIVMGPIEQHLGIPWQLSVKRGEGQLYVVLNCNLPKHNDAWSLSAEIEGQLVSTKGGIVTKNFSSTYSTTGDNNTVDSFLSWETLEKDYLVEGSIQLYVEVKVKTATGFPKKKLIHFDNPERDNGTQGVLIVEGEKFYVDKAYLASQSTVFNSLFFGKKANLKKKEFPLDDINASDFQHFLEDVHLTKVIDDENVDGILKLAKKFDEQDSIERCVKFLVKKSAKSLKDKLKIAKAYNLKDVRDHCLMNLDTKEKILSVVPGVSTDMDPTVASFLLKKVCSL